jgi:hypothetical protein
MHSVVALAGRRRDGRRLVERISFEDVSGQRGV